MLFNEVLVIFLVFSLICLQAKSTSVKNECGKKNAAKGLVYGGEQTKPNTWPWLVAFSHRVKRKQIFFCGGSLVSTKHVVSGNILVTIYR